MELDKSISNVVERWDGVDIVSIPAGRNITIKLTGGGAQETLLDVTVPSGKKWEGAVRVQFVESDA